ncbi:serine hydrolase domain-containing protein [Paracraurococcus lichenis]|uniref:Serine hydrolase n=1 Tax=Paracraurococcus lichenis TaxID=3064888 RepID=A0ABT9E461_9PROT|nr:serine hydrolase [Paracraurococcus sp. LOR1-02]MDO9710870.1 serine hydrolase [Paracraurococcus sp. LOR1-02]
MAGPDLDRRATLVAAGALATPAVRAAEEGIAGRFEALRAAGRLPGLHGVVAFHRGAPVFERYLSGADEARGRSLGEVAFGPETPHDLRSVTKSVLGLLYGIALAEGLVPPPEAPLLAQFPDCADLAADPLRARWTVRHALSMTLGTAWDESAPYTSTANSEIAMDAAPDPWRFVLDRPLVAEPGTRWIYCGGATALLGQLIVRGAGRPLPDYARARLFDPLGLGPTDWALMREGVHSAASGLRMTPRDLARIGLMVLAGGAWEGRQVVPAAWLAESFAPAIVMEDGRRYGYHWYMGRLPREGDGFDRWSGAIGNGGQRLFLLPDRALVVAVTAGNYNHPEQWRPPLAVLREAILPALPA